jgi:hypothetical protein
LRSIGLELGVSTSAISQAVKQLDEQLRVVLLTRTTCSVLSTDAGSAGPWHRQVILAGQHSFTYAAI